MLNYISIIWLARLVFCRFITLDFPELSCLVPPSVYPEELTLQQHRETVQLLTLGHQVVNSVFEYGGIIIFLSLYLSQVSTVPPELHHIYVAAYSRKYHRKACYPSYYTAYDILIVLVLPSPM